MKMHRRAADASITVRHIEHVARVTGDPQDACFYGVVLTGISGTAYSTWYETRREADAFFNSVITRILEENRT